MSRDAAKNFDMQEKRRATIASKLDQLKAQVKANRAKGVAGLSEEQVKVNQMAAAYERALSEYNYGSYVCIFKAGVKKGSRSYGIFQRAVRFAEELGIDYDLYMKGLFYFSDKWGNRAPKIHECADTRSQLNAKARVQNYLDMVAAGEASEAKIVGPVTPARPVSSTVKALNSERQLRTFMKNFGISEEEVFLRFGRGKEAYLYFDKVWLEQNETYKRLKAENQI